MPRPQRRGIRLPRHLGGAYLDEEALGELGVDYDDVMELSDEEQDIMFQCLHEMMTHGHSPTAYQLMDVDYKREPVSFEQFITDDYYLGRFTSDLRPKLREFLIDLFDSGKQPPLEVILGGSLGWGKTTIAALALTYVVYRLGCMRNVHAFFGLMPGARIMFAIYSVSIEQAEETAYGKMDMWINSSPYFREHMPRNPKFTARIRFKNCPVQVLTGSKEVHAIGKDIYAFILDEANFLNNKNTNAEDQGRAYDIYHGALNRLKTRFKDDTTGNISGMVWLLSSKRSKASFLEQHVKEAAEDISEGRTRLVEFSRWAVEPHKYANKKWFKVEIGNRFYPSRILAPEEAPRDGASVIEVPEHFRNEFTKDVDKALRELAGIATESITPLIQDAKMVEKCYHSELRHPFKKDFATIDILEPDLSFDQIFLPDRLFSVRGGIYVPRREPDAPRYIHLDFGITGDAFGMACVHISDIRSVKREREDGTWFDEKAPVVDVDFVIRATPLMGSEVDFSKVRAFIINLRDLGLPIWRVSMDSVWSRDTMQTLAKLQFDCIAYSVDKTDEAYIALRQGIYEQRLRMYNYPILTTELLDLQRDADAAKVDHPKVSPSTGKKGSKDVSDALAGAYYQAILDKEVGLTVPNTPRDRLGDASRGMNTNLGSVSWKELDAEMMRELRPWQRA